MFSGSRSSDDRTIPLSIIAERTKLSIEDVEHLLMKSLSVSSSLVTLMSAEEFKIVSKLIIIINPFLNGPA